MSTAPAPLLPMGRPELRPTPGQVQATWATILLSLTLFWYGVAMGANALWHQLGR
ncbi:hypothetical protein [Nocardioides stalactiti]|uniref:hypothetical protein n=1 Tax=Nocardioides stalactiti TaxID=2755356 RepID=UPI001601FF0E|nr:hypothetical protein [Nocardioides stalactiti]